MRIRAKGTFVGLIVMVLWTLACSPEVNATISNKTNIRVQVFEGTETTIPVLGFWLEPGDVSSRAWRTREPQAIRERIEARDESGKVVFCKIYTWRDRTSDTLWEVSIVLGQSLCKAAGSQ